MLILKSDPYMFSVLPGISVTPVELEIDLKLHDYMVSYQTMGYIL